MQGFFDGVKFSIVMQALIDHNSNAGVAIYEWDEPDPIPVTHQMNGRIISDLVGNPLVPFDVVVRHKITHVQSSFYPEPCGAALALHLPSKPEFFLQNRPSPGRVDHPLAGDRLFSHPVAAFNINDFVVGIPFIQNDITYRNPILYTNADLFV